MLSTALLYNRHLLGKQHVLGDPRLVLLQHVLSRAHVLLRGFNFLLGTTDTHAGVERACEQYQHGQSRTKNPDNHLEHSSC